jgi:hypothetical protein
MRIIFDENVPLPLRQFFASHSVTTVRKEGLAGVRDIISWVDGWFDVLLLSDKNLRYEQNLLDRQIALVELPSNRWPVLRQIAPQIVRAVEAAEMGSYTVIEHHET